MLKERLCSLLIVDDIMVRGSINPCRRSEGWEWQDCALISRSSMNEQCLPWSPLRHESCSSCLRAVARPTSPGRYYEAGCKTGVKAVWLTHRVELAEQTRRMLTDAGISAINLTWPPGEDAPLISNGVVILMAQTVGRRTNRMQVWGNFNSADLLGNR